MSIKTLLKSRYEITGELSEGGFGKTFLGIDTDMPSRPSRVIKQLKPIGNNPQIAQIIQEKFEQEAACLEELGEQSRQIPKLYAYFEEAGQFYLVEEGINGKTLTKIVEEQGSLRETEVKEILINLLNVLDYIQNHRIIHRDIKPDNIIVRESDGLPVLIDFGAVKATMGTTVTASGSLSPASTIVIGTPGFMSLEQSNGRPTFSSDLHALGLTMIYLLTGKHPQELETDPMTGEIIWRNHAPNVSDFFAAILDKAIRIHLRDRYFTAKDMLNALQSTAISGTPIESTVVSVSPNSVSSQIPYRVEQSSQQQTVVQGKDSLPSQPKQRPQIALIFVIWGILSICGVGGLIAAQLWQQQAQRQQQEQQQRAQSPQQEQQQRAQSPQQEQQQQAEAQHQQEIETRRLAEENERLQKQKQLQEANAILAEQIRQQEEQRRHNEAIQTPIVEPTSSGRGLKELDDLADRIFYERHPELRGRKITPDKIALAQEWQRIRNCEAIVDYQFYQRHPELNGRKIRPSESALTQQWLQIKRNITGCN